MEKLKVSEYLDSTKDKSLYEVMRDICDCITGHFSADEMCREAYKEQIDWEGIIEYLRHYSQEHDGFNIFPIKISSYDDLLLLRDNVLDAYDGKKPFIRRTCRDCHKVYYIYISEKNWMERKGYPLPKRCTSCRKLRNGEHDSTVAISGVSTDKREYLYD